MKSLALDKNRPCNINKAGAILDKFFYQSAYPLVLGAIAVCSYIFKLQLVGFGIYLFFASILLVKQRDATPILPLLIFLMSLFSDVSVTRSSVFYIMLIIPAICLIYHFIKFPPVPFCFGNLFLPLLAVSTAMFSGGLLSTFLSDYPNGLLYSLPLGPGLLIIYLYFNNYLRPPKNFDVKKYICYVMVVLGLICALEFCYHFYMVKSATDKNIYFSELGWINSNGLATLMLLCLPCCCYLLSKSKNITLWYALVLLLYVIIILSRSDGALGVAVLFTPFLIFISYKPLNKANKRYFINLTFIAIIGFCLAGLYLEFTGKLAELLQKYANSKTVDSGRTQLFKNALNVFIENPIFGGGMGYYNDMSYESHTILRNFSFHSTVFTVLGCMGVVGVLAYVYYFYARFSIITEKNTTFNKLIFIGFAMFEAYGLVDTCEFSAIPQMITLTLIILITDMTNLKGERLPLLPNEWVK